MMEDIIPLILEMFLAIWASESEKDPITEDRTVVREE